MIDVFAPAKLNLTLAVLGRRSDGFHEIESWVAPIGLYDRVGADPFHELSLMVTPMGTTAPLGEHNLVWRAARVLAERSGHRLGARFELEKEIPIGAGLGGGSSDAAAALRALNQAWRLGWSDRQLADCAPDIGSDVAFFLQSSQAVIRGRGDRVDPINGWAGWAVVVIPPFGLSTADVYRAWPAPASRAANREQPWRRLPLRAEELMPMLFNDLEAAAYRLEPRLAALCQALAERTGRVVRMTGSGSCLFTLFDAEPEAHDWASRATGASDSPARSRVVRVLLQQAKEG